MLEFSDKKVVSRAVIEDAITEEDIANIVITAFEGGINYWAGLDKLTPEWEDKPKGEPNSTWATKILIEGKEVKLYDVEGEDTFKPLTLNGILKGIAQNAKERAWDADHRNGDATTADAIIQYAMFGEIVYG
jgi:hypothetical protein